MINTPLAAMPAQLHLSTHNPSPGTVVVAVAGEVDLATAPALHTALLDALTAHTPAVLDVDLSACTFLDCSGIRVLVAAHASAQAAGCRMWARYPQRLVRLVLEVTKLSGLLTAPNDAALAAVITEAGNGAPSARARTMQAPATLVAA